MGGLPAPCLGVSILTSQLLGRYLCILRWKKWMSSPTQTLLLRSALSSPISVIGLLMNLLTNLISSVSKATTPNEIDSKDILSTLNNCVDSLSSALIPDRDGHR